VAYTGEADLLEKLRHFTTDDDHRQRVASAGQGRTLRDHTYDRRMQTVTAILADRLAGAR
jgi:spore maturation protein CgeB